MKKNLALLSFIFLVTISFQSMAQTYAFKILVNKGKNEIKKGTTWSPLVVGQTLTSKDEVRVAANSYLGLVHSPTGKPLEVKTAGVHPVKKLEEMVNSGPTVLKKYTDFILSSNEEKRNKLNATGAVHRGLNDVTLYLPGKEKSPVFYNNTVSINWDTTDLNGPYEVVLISLFGDELKRIQTTKNEVVLDMESPDFKAEDNIMVEVYSKGDRKRSTEGEFALKRLSKSDKARIETLMKDVVALTTEENALNAYFLAGFYEQNNLIIDATTAYLKAIKLAPDVSMYKEAYQEFLLRSGLKPVKAKK